MNLWTWIGAAAESSTEAVGAVIDWLGGQLGAIADPVARKQVAFSVALIALSAKMAKADGIVTSAEIAAFERVFAVPAREERNVARMFELAQHDVAGFESYARKIAAIYGDDRESLADVIDGLFAIAAADGAVHDAEYVFLERVAAIFGIEGRAFEAIAARHVVPEEGDPYLALGVDRSLSLAEISARYRSLAPRTTPTG